MKGATLIRATTPARTIIHGADYLECARLEGIGKNAVHQTLSYLVKVGFLTRLSSGVYRRK